MQYFCRPCKAKQKPWTKAIYIVGQLQQSDVTYSSQQRLFSRYVFQCCNIGLPTDKSNLFLILVPIFGICSYLSNVWSGFGRLYREYAGNSFWDPYLRPDGARHSILFSVKAYKQQYICCKLLRNLSYKFLKCDFRWWDTVNCTIDLPFHICGTIMCTKD